MLDPVRFLAAFSVGVLLSLGGVLSQALTQNELASPSILGMNALSVLCVIFWRLLFPEFPWEYPSWALYSAICLAGFFLLRKNSQSYYSNYPPTHGPYFLLIGMSFNLLVGAFYSFFQFLSMVHNRPFPNELWYGSFRMVTLNQSLVVFTWTLLCWLLAIFLAKDLRKMNFGPSWALGMGLNIRTFEKKALLLAFLSVGPVACFFGVFSFVGLLFPHLLKSFSPFAKNPKLLIYIGLPIGGLCLAFLDTLLSHFFYYGAELPAGMMTAVIGTLPLMVIAVRRGVSVVK